MTLRWIRFRSEGGSCQAVDLRGELELELGAGMQVTTAYQEDQWGMIQSTILGSPLSVASSSAITTRSGQDTFKLPSSSTVDRDVHSILCCTTCYPYLSYIYTYNPFSRASCFTFLAASLALTISLLRSGRPTLALACSSIPSLRSRARFGPWTS